jgi:cold shock CspA family protein
MDQTPEIVFRNMRHSKDIEADVLKRLAKLEKIFSKIVSCRIVIELPNKKEKTDDIPNVLVELLVPGKTLVVRRDHHARERHQKPNVTTALHDAFEAAALKLKDYKERLQRDVKDHPAPLRARVSNLRRDREFGFLTTSEGKELYFHKNSVMNGDFDTLKDGDVVGYVEDTGDTGPTASKVWLGTSEKQ